MEIDGKLHCSSAPSYRCSGHTAKDGAETLQDELLSVVEDAKEDGKFDEAEKDMIEAVVQFRNRTVAQVHALLQSSKAGPILQRR